MNAAPDDRIPLRFGAAASVRPGEALLVEVSPVGSPPVGGVASGLPAGRAVARFGAGGARHLAGCACCTGRGAAAAALAALFQDRAIGRVAWFDAVLAVVRDPAAVAAELRGDRLAAARFRVLEGTQPGDIPPSQP